MAFCCAGAYGSPQACSAGPVMQTEYLPAVKATCPYAYAYPYDDHIATIACTTTTEYVVAFYCPALTPIPTPPPTPTPTPPPPTPPPTPSPAASCSVGDTVVCPGSAAMCGGNQC